MLDYYAGDPAKVYTTVNVTPGESYTLSGYIVGSAKLYISAGDETVFSSAGGSSWQLCSVDITIPDGITTAQVGGYLDYDDPSRLDDLCFAVSTPSRAAGTSGASNEETLYTYGDAEWGDLLTAYDGEEITYDGIGNPLSYRGWTMSWQGGRRLAGMTKGSDTLSFAYNESGLRTSKTVNGVTHSYIWQGSKLAADITDAYALYFHYDSSGEVIGFTRAVNGTDTEYFYVKNLQGDILKVITADGTEAASYTYDAWGMLLTAAGDIADVNPLRYRGYFYDTETSLYYLQSRYYDPEVCRFINPDAYASTGQGILGTNMFAYCGGNPVNNFDSSGCIPRAVEDRYIHDEVLKYICGLDDTNSLQYTKTCIYFNGIDWYGGWGFCDLYNSATGEVWELKKDSSSRRCSTVFANLQLGKYINGVLKYSPELDLCRPYTTIISDGHFFTSSILYEYEVNYRNEGNGILKYSYSKKPTEELLAIKAAIGAAGAALESAAQAILGWRSKANRGIYFPGSA